MTLILFLLSIICPQSALQPDTGYAIAFETRHIDLGAVKKGEKRTGQFVFRNTGNEDIVIELVSACECTTVDYPRKPIPPGAQGTIDFVFDSAEKDVAETIDIDLNLKNIDPKTGYPALEIISYTFDIIP